jgi:DNA helicase-2/ATP-dependent DNA helicase PcrA
MNTLLDGLNPAQQRAVTTTEGPVLVLAGPGSGKTRVLTYRVAHLIQALGVRPWRVMAVTFTNKAAREMKSRLVELIGNADLSNLTIGTFHAICVRLLRREAATLDLDRNFVIYDDSDQQSLIRQAIKELDINDKLYRPRAMHTIISRAKTNLFGPHEYVPRTYKEEVARRVYARYQDLLAQSNALDFDDLLMRVVLAFRKQPEIAAKYQHRYRYVLVDEFQDTNTVQYELVRQFSGGSGNLFVVGDEDQSIYAFRGADFHNVLRFEKDCPDAVKILLEQNYRSTQTILDAANAVIAPNIQRTPKALFTRRAKGTPLYVHEAYDENQEGRWVVQTIQQLEEQGMAPGSCAIMYRTNAQSRALEEAFLAQGMPYKLVGATRFYARREIKDLMAYLRIIHNPYDAVSLSRVINVPPRAIGAKTRSGLDAWAASMGVPVYDALQELAGGAAVPISPGGRKALLRFYEMWKAWRASRAQFSALELLDQVIEQAGYGAYLRDGSDEGEERWENVLELRAVAAGYSSLPVEESLITFLEEVSLVSDVDNLDETDAPTLLTLHSAKGLEFDVVFIVGLDDKLLPHSRSFDDPDAMEEERRLFYVGVTRARDHLYLLHTFRRSMYGSSELSEASRFLADVPAHLKVDVGAYAPQQAGVTLPRSRSRPGLERDQVTSRRRGTGEPGPFKSGEKVRHTFFGEGMVIEVKQRGGDWDVTVAFRGRGIKTLAAGFANLEKVS